MEILFSINWWPVVAVAAISLIGLVVLAEYFSSATDESIYVKNKKESWLTVTIFFAAATPFITYILVVRETIDEVMSSIEEARTYKIVYLAIAALIVFMVVFTAAYYLEKLIHRNKKRGIIMRLQKRVDRKTIQARFLRNLMDNVEKPGNYLLYSDGTIERKFDQKKPPAIVKVRDKKHTLTKEDIEYLCQFKDEPGKRLYLN